MKKTLTILFLFLSLNVFAGRNTITIKFKNIEKEFSYTSQRYWDDFYEKQGQWYDSYDGKTVDCDYTSLGDWGGTANWIDHRACVENYWNLYDAIKTFLSDNGVAVTSVYDAREMSEDYPSSPNSEDVVMYVKEVGEEPNHVHYNDHTFWGISINNRLIDRITVKETN